MEQAEYCPPQQVQTFPAGSPALKERNLKRQIPSRGKHLPRHGINAVNIISTSLNCPPCNACILNKKAYIHAFRKFRGFSCSAGLVKGQFVLVSQKPGAGKHPRSMVSRNSAALPENFPDAMLPGRSNHHSACVLSWESLY